MILRDISVVDWNQLQGRLGKELNTSQIVAATVDEDETEKVGFRRDVKQECCLLPNFIQYLLINRGKPFINKRNFSGSRKDNER